MTVLVVERYAPLCALLVKALQRSDISATPAPDLEWAESYYRCDGYEVVLICGSYYFSESGRKFSDRVRRAGSKVVLLSMGPPPEDFNRKFYVQKNPLGFLEEVVAKIKELTS